LPSNLNSNFFFFSQYSSHPLKACIHSFLLKSCQTNSLTFFIFSFTSSKLKSIFLPSKGSSPLLTKLPLLSSYLSPFLVISFKILGKTITFKVKFDFKNYLDKIYRKLKLIIKIMNPVTIEINNPTILKTYDLNKIKSTLETILLDLKNNFVEF
jgi:hypothetical protein